jgi:hypothetical protein
MDGASHRLHAAEVSPESNHENQKREVMNENKRKQIEAKLLQLFTQTGESPSADAPVKRKPHVVKVIRRRKGKPDLQVA